MTRAASRPWAGLAIIGLGAALPTLDFAVNIAFPAITEAFALPTRDIRWVAVCYVLVYSSLMLVAGAIGDRIGYRRVFRAGLMLGMVAFTLCALAQSYAWLLGARMLQGVSAALLHACAPALVTSLYDESRRTQALGAYAGMTAATGVAAPLIGGVVVAWLGWAGVFWFRAPLAAATLMLLPLLHVPQGPRLGGLSGFDFRGAALLAATLACLLLAPSLATGGAFAAAAGSAAAGLALAAAYSRHSGSRGKPLLPRAQARDPRFALPSVVSTALHVTTFTIPLLGPYYLMRIAHQDAVGSGWLMSTWALGALGGSLVAARMVAAMGARAAARASGLLAALGLAGVATWPLQAPLAWLIAPMVVQGIGIGIFQVAYTDTIVAALPIEQRGVAGSLTLLTRTVGIVLGAALWTALLHAGEAAQVASGAEPAHAFLGAFRTVFVAAACGLALAFAASSLVRGVWSGR